MLAFHIWDVFTDRPFSGNPLAVVEGAEGLSNAQMQIVARQFNLSETIFVMAPRDPAHCAQVRIFTPMSELPFAGHPTIGCALHLAGGADADLVLEEEAGLVPVTILEGLAEFVAPILAVAHDGHAEAHLIAQALDLRTVAVGFGAHRPGIWQGGPAFLFVPIRDLHDLAAARPIEPFWSRAMAAAHVDSAYLYAPRPGGFQARMFWPASGIPEDPATGSASAILAGQLLASGALEEGENRVALRQGVEMGRPSEITMTAMVEGGALREVRVAGRAAKVAEGHIAIPEAP